MIVQTTILGKSVELQLRRTEYGCISWNAYQDDGARDRICRGSLGTDRDLDDPEVLGAIRTCTAWSMSHRDPLEIGRAERLACLRFEIEQGTGEHVKDARINAACLLYDVGRFLLLSDDEIRDALGPISYRAVTQGEVMHLQHNPCPFGATCSLVQCLGRDCPEYGDRFTFAFGDNDDGRDRAD
jgi:hypothetical protein